MLANSFRLAIIVGIWNNGATWHGLFLPAVESRRQFCGVRPSGSGGTDVAPASCAYKLKPMIPPYSGELLAGGLWGDSARNRFPNRELIDSRSYDSPHGRTMGYGGGLYSNAFGDALWVWNPKATNNYELWRIH
jgi:hypothetical protein